MTTLRDLALPAGIGISLGVTAFAVDALPGLVGDLVNPVISSVLSWTVAAMLLGYRARSAPKAAILAVTSLALAVLVYYLLILVGSRRWGLGTAEDGGSSTLVDLASVARAIGFWLLASACVGATLGLLRYVIARGSVYYRSLASGVAVGIIGSESWFNTLVVLPRWGDGWYHLASWPLLALLTVAVVAVIAARARVSWLITIPTGIAALGISVITWSQIHSIRSLL